MPSSPYNFNHQQQAMAAGISPTTSLPGQIDYSGSGSSSNASPGSTANNSGNSGGGAGSHHPYFGSEATTLGTSSSTQPPTATTSTSSTVPAACLGCRSKHLKCDGQTPCSRCSASEIQCLYVASRRGYKGPRRGTANNPNKRQATSPPETTPGTTPGCPMANGFAGTHVPVVTSNVYPADTQVYGRHGEQLSQSGSLRQTTTDVPLPERCVDAFYHFFHPSHPFALPKKFLFAYTKDAVITPLLAAIRWVGSLFIDPERITPQIRSAFLEEALRHVNHPSIRDGYLVQAMMVLVVGLDGSTEQEQAKDLLLRAEQLALELRLNTRAFASMYGKGIPVLEESWRRTWWDLFIIDGMVAGVHQATNFALYDTAPYDVALPCEEAEYLSGVIPPSKFLEDLEDREFSSPDAQYSSFSYRILCGRNLGYFMRRSPIQGADDENLTRVETALTNWRLHLPKSKRSALDANGQHDEMMFQALMMLNATSIMLHQQHSQLDSSPARSVTSCAPYKAVPTGDEAYNIHTHHTLIAANEISKLITHRAPLLTHTHFFTCVVTLSSIVHLSRWAKHFYAPISGPTSAILMPTPYQQSLSSTSVTQDVDDDLRQLIRLNIGALSQLSSVWGAATRSKGQVQGVASEIYQMKKQQQQANPSYWLGMTQDQVVNDLSADETIYGDIQSFQGLGNVADLMR